MFDKSTQKELKAKYRELLNDVWTDEGMVNFCSKKAEVVFKTESGFFLEVEKEGIKKNFCFGYSDSRYDTEDRDRAYGMVRHARNSVEYFREKNLERLDSCIKFYSDTNNNLYFQNHYAHQKNNVMKHIAAFDGWNLPNDILSGDFKEYTPASENDRKLIVEAYKKERELFAKRLESYIKRYGLSKVRAWAYWQDE